MVSVIDSFSENDKRETTVRFRQEANMTTATGNNVRRAYNRAVKAMENAVVNSIAHEESAGFIVPAKKNQATEGDTTGYQVFVRICRYSENLLKSDPLSGGLLVSATPKKRTKKG